MSAHRSESKGRCPTVPEREGSEDDHCADGVRSGLLERQYWVLVHRANLLLTWHAPWCRCELGPVGWRFVRALHYVAGFGFELTWLRRPVDAALAA